MSSRTRRQPNLLMIGALALGMTNAHAADAPQFKDPPFKHYLGYHGPDGTQNYPGCNPPIEFGGPEKKNILWETPMPFIGLSTPVVVKGRVFVTSEYGYKSDFPELLCLDAETGKVLWQRQINHLEQAIPDPAERAKVADVWHRRLERYRIENALKMVKKDPEARKEWEDKLQAIPPIGREAEKLVSRYSLGFEAFRNYQHDNGAMVGTAFPTPCTDGEHIYVHTLWSQIACYDFDGNLKWLKWWGDKKRDVRIGKERMKEFFRSPILWYDLLIVDMEVIRAFDKRTGELRWEVDRAAWNLPLDRGHGEHLSPKVFRAGDTDLLWCYSPSTPVAVRCVDGKSFPVEGWDHPGIMTALNPESPDTLCLGGGSYHGGWPRAPEALPYKNPPPAAIKLAFEGETLKAKVLWTGVSGRPIISDVCSLAYGRGRVVVMGNLDNKSNQNLGATVDATTGKGIAGLDAAGQRIANGAPWSRHIYAIAGGRSYGLWENKQRADDEPCEAVMGVYDLEGKKLAENRILGPRLEGEFKAMSLAAAMPNRFNYSQPFTLSGDRIYIRSNYLLHCIGEK